MHAAAAKPKLTDCAVSAVRAASGNLMHQHCEGASSEAAHADSSLPSHAASAWLLLCCSFHSTPHCTAASPSLTSLAHGQRHGFRHRHSPAIVVTGTRTRSHTPECACSPSPPLLIRCCHRFLSHRRHLQSQQRHPRPLHACMRTWSGEGKTADAATVTAAVQGRQSVCARRPLKARGAACVRERKATAITCRRAGADPVQRRQAGETRTCCRMQRSDFDSGGCVLSSRCVCLSRTVLRHV